MVAETIAEVLCNDIEKQAVQMAREAAGRGENLTADELRAAVKKRFERYGDWSKMGAAVTALLLKHDVNVAIDAATNAIENNCQAAIVGVLAELTWAEIISIARVVAPAISALLSATEIPTYCNKHGPELTFLKLVDDGKIKISEGPTGTLSYTVGDQTFSTPEAAWSAVVQDVPFFYRDELQGHRIVLSTQSFKEKLADKVKTSGSKANTKSKPSASAPLPPEWEPSHDRNKRQKDDNFKYFSLKEHTNAKGYRHERFGKFHESKDKMHYYTKDRGKHGGSAWKVYKKTKKGLDWVADLDKYGDVMVDKYKGSIGKFIPAKELIPF